MKEDVLEQIVEDNLHSKGYFTRHNVKFRPAKDHKQFSAKDHSNASDIDVLAFDPKRRGTDRVWPVSCKSWQQGFSPAQWIEKIDDRGIIFGREACRGFLELADEIWDRALIKVIESLTGARKFTFVTAVTKLLGDAARWETHNPFFDNIEGNPIKVLVLREMLDEVNKIVDEYAGVVRSWMFVASDQSLGLGRDIAKGRRVEFDPKQVGHGFAIASRFRSTSAARRPNGARERGAASICKPP